MTVRGGFIDENFFYGLSLFAGQSFQAYKAQRGSRSGPHVDDFCMFVVCNSLVIRELQSLVSGPQDCALQVTF